MVAGGGRDRYPEDGISVASVSLERVPLLVIWGIALASGASFLVRFSLLMPTPAFRWRISLGLLSGMAFIVLAGLIKELPVRELLGYFSIGMLSIVLASLGQAQDIRRWPQVARYSGEPQSLQPGQMKFTVKLVVLITVGIMFLQWTS